jgi:hypothetical protein
MFEAIKNSPFMGHMFSSTLFVILVIGLILGQTKLKEKFNFVKFHKALGAFLVVYLIGYMIVDYMIEKEAFILLTIPSLLGIMYTGVKRDKCPKYLHVVFILIFLVTLLLHVFDVVR